MTDTAWIELAALLVTCGVTIGSCIVTIRRGTEDVKTSVFKKIDEIEHDRTEFEFQMERRMGEVGTALREKISQVELHIRDNYVDKTIMSQMVDMMVKSSDKQFELIRSDIKRLHDKMDFLRGQGPAPQP